MPYFLQRILFYLFRLHFSPKKNITQDSVGVCSLLGHMYVNMYIYTVSSFLFQIKMDLPTFIIDDGTLTTNDKRKLKHFFQTTIMSRSEADEKMKKILSQKKFPHFYKYRFGRYIFSKLKFDALLLCPFSRVICLDSDVLFFSPPREIIDWINHKGTHCLYNLHDWSLIKKTTIADLEHSLRCLLQKYYQPNFQVTFNAGLFCLPNKNLLDFRKIDQILKIFNEIGYDRISMADETTFGLLFSDPKIGKPLPPHRYVVTALPIDYLSGNLQEATSIHYSGPTKQYFLKDAITLALKTRFFR